MRLSAAAEKRLTVMQTLDALGAGFTLASHDLDIRGAGNLLGDEQSGHIREVGIELYQQMLEDAVAELRAGEGQARRAGARLDAEHLARPAGADPGGPMCATCRCGLACTAASARWHRTPRPRRWRPNWSTASARCREEVENLLQVVALKRACREAGVEKLEAGPKGMVLSFRGNAFSNPAGLVAWLASKGGLVRLRPDHKLAISREMDVATRLQVRARHAG